MTLSRNLRQALSLLHLPSMPPGPKKPFRKPPTTPRPVDDDDEFASKEDDSVEEEIPSIQSYRKGELRAGGISYHTDVLVFPHGIRGGWRRAQPGVVTLEDLRTILADRPEVVIFGTGAPGEAPVVVEEEAVLYLEAMMAEVLVLPTEEAVRRYNELGPARHTCAALIL